VIPVHVMKAYVGNGGVVPLTPTLGQTIPYCERRKRRCCCGL